MSIQSTNTQAVPPQLFSQVDTIDLRKIFYQLLRYWYLFLIFPIITLAAAYLYLRYSTPIYQVKGSILIKDQESSGLSTDMISEQLVGFGLTPPAKVIDEAKILKSRTLMKEVIDSLNIGYQIKEEGRIRDVDQYGNYPFFLDSFQLDDQYDRTTDEPISFRIKVLDPSSYTLEYEEMELNAQFGEWHENEFGEFFLTYNNNRREKEERNAGLSQIIPDSEEEAFLLDVHPALNATLTYLEDFVINYEEDSYVIELSMQDEVPQRGIDVINNIIDAYNRSTIKDKNEVGQNTLSFIDDRLLLLTDELSEVEKDVEQYKTKEGITVDASSDLQFLLNKIGEYDKELTDLEIRRSILDYLTEYLEDSENQYELIPSNLDVGNTSLSQLLFELNQKLQERKRLLQTVTDDYLAVTALNDEIASLRFNISENIKNIKRDIDIAIRQVSSRSSEFERQLNKTPRRERELLEIKRQQFIKENLYLFLLEKREETAISLVATTPNARIIDRPELVDTEPVAPKKLPIYVGSLFLGLVLPSGIVILQGLLKNTIESEKDIKEITSVPILGKLAENKKSANIVVKQGSRSAIAEMFRLLRTNINFLIPNDQHKTFVVTSSMSGEGKSFIAINLGMSFALSGKKVILIGLDLRKPKMASYLSNNVPTTGISSYLVGQATKEEIINAFSENENLFYIASGLIPPNPSELILNGRLEVLLEELKQEYDVIIIDSPPVGLVTDSILLKDMVSATLYISRFGVTKKEQLHLIDQLHKEQKLVNPAIVLNGVKKGGGSSGYGYGYGYGYYVED